MNRIQKEIPQDMNARKTPLHSTKTLINNKMTPTVYQRKINKFSASKYSSQKCINIWRR